MAQFKLNFQIESLPDTMKVTAFGGISRFLDFLVCVKFFKLLSGKLSLRERGWPEGVHLLWILVTLLIGGEHVSDVAGLSQDQALTTMLDRILRRHLRKDARRRYKQLVKQFGAPSESSLRRLLEEFHDEGQELARKASEEKAFIPQSNRALKGLCELNGALLAPLFRRHNPTEVTLDMDATLIESHKANALYTYKGYPGYQPLNVYWAEFGVMLYSSFRDGNVVCGYRQLQTLEQALLNLPSSVRVVRLRLDTQGYEWELLRYCAEGKNARFGVIEFVSGVDVTEEFRKAVEKATVWKPYHDVSANGDSVETNQEYAEIAFAPNNMVKGKKGTRYRFVAIRERLQSELPCLESEQAELPFPSYESGKTRYKLYGLVTNRLHMDGEKLIHWHRERCGCGEHAHAELKSALAGENLPSNKFGANAAWWQLNVMAFNLQRMMAVLVLCEPWTKRKLKALRFFLFNVGAWVQTRSRQVVVRLETNKAQWFREIGARIMALADDLA